MKCLCINIDSDTESWALSQEQFAKVGLTVERFSAITGKNRPLAFNQSVLAAMKYAQGDDLLLFEDDVMFDDKASRYGLFDSIESVEYLNALTLHFGANIIGTDNTVWVMPEYSGYGSSLVKLNNAWQSHSTWYSKECVDFILNNLDGTKLDEDNNIFDDWLRRKVLSQGRSYLLNPMICYQRPRRSAIWNNHADYTGCHKQGNKWLKDNL